MSDVGRCAPYCCRDASFDRQLKRVQNGVLPLPVLLEGLRGDVRHIAEVLDVAPNAPAPFSYDFRIGHHYTAANTCALDT